MAERRGEGQRVVVTMEFGNGFCGDVRRNKSHLAASGEQVRVSRQTLRSTKQQAEKKKGPSEKATQYRSARQMPGLGRCPGG